jgi:hypothetical protein
MVSREKDKKARSELEEQATKKWGAAGLFVTGEIEGRRQGPERPEDADTVRMTPQEVEATLGEIGEKTRKITDSVEIRGAEAEAARLIADKGLEAVEQTLDIDPPSVRAVTLPCRMCGRKVLAPKNGRRRVSSKSKQGTLCEGCGNVFCRQHSVPSTGFFASLFAGARYRCQLCCHDGADGKEGQT